MEGCEYNVLAQGGGVSVLEGVVAAQGLTIVRDYLWFFFGRIEGDGLAWVTIRQRILFYLTEIGDLLLRPLQLSVK